MSEGYSLNLTNVGKKYPLFKCRSDAIMYAFNLQKFFPRLQSRIHEFWALRSINFSLRVGSKLGIIGRNGSGKTTMLKLITGNIPCTEGKIETHGTVQALMTAGAGFHPEFSGRENIQASLVYNGLSAEEIQEAVRDIETFTELGAFLDQPFKTYSAGMNMRLIFATATAIKPDILIIDELLGAGDAYFAIKSAERMTRLVNSGSSVLIASHSMADILRYCDEAIWIERGRIIRVGDSLEVVKAYDEFIHGLEDRRLRLRNKKLGRRDNVLSTEDLNSDVINIDFQIESDLANRFKISEVRLMKNHDVEDTLHLGSAQDYSSSQTSYVVLHDNNWSGPCSEQDVHWRALAVNERDIRRARGRLCFCVHEYETDKDYEIQVFYSCEKTARLSLDVFLGNEPLVKNVQIPVAEMQWAWWSLRLSASPRSSVSADKSTTTTSNDGEKPRSLSVTKWPGEGRLVVESVSLLGQDGRERAVFSAGSRLILRVLVESKNAGRYDIIPGASLFRRDGIMISQFVGQSFSVDLPSGGRKQLYLDLGQLSLGDGFFVFSVAIYNETLEWHDRQDTVDRSYEFQVVGNNDVDAVTICHLPGNWKDRVKFEKTEGD